MPVKDKSVTVCVWAEDVSAGGGKTGDSANITLKRVSDGTVATIAGSVSEVNSTDFPGLYKITLTGGENNGEMMIVGGKSSTADVVITPVQWTNEVNVAALVAGEQSATDLKDFADAGYDPATNKIEGVKTLDTNGDKTGYSISGAITTLDGLENLSATQVNAEVDNALNTAIPGSPTAGSINERVKALDDNYTAARAAYLDNLNNHTPQTGDTFGALPANFSSLVISGSGAVDSLVQGFLNNTIAETTAGRIATNFDTFFENSDAATTKVLDDVGSGSGGGSGDWTTTEKNQIRHRLGVDGTTAAPSTNTPILGTVSANVIQWKGSTPNDMQSGRIDVYVGFMATDVITSTALNSSAVTEIQTGLPTDSSIADAVWNEAQVDHTAVGSFGEIASEIASILGDTNELQTDWQDGGRLDLLIDAILEDAGTSIPGLLTTISNFIDTEVADIKAVTDLIPDGGAMTSIAQATALATVSTAVTGIKTVTDDLTSAANVANTVLSTNVSGVEGTMPEHCLGTVILATLEGAISGSDWEIRRTDGATIHATKTLTTDASANPVVGIQ